VIALGHSSIRRRPSRDELRAANHLALKIDRKVINDLNKPCLRVPLRIELYQSDQESLLDDIAGIFLFESMLPGGTADKRKEITSIEFVESGRIR